MRSLTPRFVWPLVAAVAIATGSYFGTTGLASHAWGAEASSVAVANDLSQAFRSVHDSLKDAVVNITS